MEIRGELIKKFPVPKSHTQRVHLVKKTQAQNSHACTPLRGPHSSFGSHEISLIKWIGKLHRVPTPIPFLYAREGM
jgi:hypothetical protein